MKRVVYKTKDAQLPDHMLKAAIATGKYYKIRVRQNLYLCCASNAKENKEKWSWQFWINFHKITTARTLGHYPDILIEEVLERVKFLRKKVREGRDPRNYKIYRIQEPINTVKDIPDVYPIIVKSIKNQDPFHLPEFYKNLILDFKIKPVARETFLRLIASKHPDDNNMAAAFLDILSNYTPTAIASLLEDITCLKEAGYLNDRMEILDPYVFNMERDTIPEEDDEFND